MRLFCLRCVIITGCDRTNGCVGATAACASTISRQFFLIANSDVFCPLRVCGRFDCNLFPAILLFDIRWLLLSPTLSFFAFFV